MISIGHYKSFRLVILATVLMLISNCKKEIETIYPDITTKPVIVSNTDYADCGGLINTNGNVEIISRGVIWGTNPDLLIGTHDGYTFDGSGSGEYSSILSPLEPNTVYYVRAYAETRVKILYGNILEFGLWHGPSVYTTGATSVKGISAILTGLIIPKNSPTIVSIQLGADTNYFLKKPMTNEPITGTGLYKLSYFLDGLEPNTVYHYRVTAENAVASSEGRDTVFRTKPIFKDIDNNIYPVADIGNQTWMMENLKTVHYSNGEPIPNKTGYIGSLVIGNYWEYNNNPYFAGDYGRLYNYYAAIDSRNICPTGWHVPTLAEFNELISFLGGVTEGGKMKENGTTHWNSPNTGATNESDFTALPGGYWEPAGLFTKLGQNGYWFTSTGKSDILANGLSLSYNDSKITVQGLYKNAGCSIRCIKGTVPVVITAGSGNITGTSAVVYGTINPNGEPVAVSIDYGLTQSYGSRLNITDQTFSGNSPLEVEGNITGLQNGTVYHYRLRAESIYGVVYGKDAAFQTNNIPSVATNNIVYISPGTVMLRGVAIANNSTTTVTFLFGETSDYGQVLVPENNIIEGKTQVYFKYLLTGLPADKIYHFTIAAVNEIGQKEGKDISFTTELLQDTEGNKYGINLIRSKYWMLQNLKTTHFSNGDPIPEIQDLSEFGKLTTEAYCNYDNSSDMGNEYGRLYNGSVITDTRNICPIGWHVPTIDQWTDLLNSYLEPSLREEGTTHWKVTSGNGDNISGFSALPGGYRHTSGFRNIGYGGYWWTIPSATLPNPYLLCPIDTNDLIHSLTTGSDKYGLSVRCIKESLPLGKTGPAFDITPASATLSGSVNGNGLTTSVSLEWGVNSISLKASPAIPGEVSGSNSQDITVMLTNLTPGTTYYYRIKAVNSAGTGYGILRVFMTPLSK